MKVKMCLLFILAAACSGAPVPAWQTRAARSLERFEIYWLEGRDRDAASAFQTARSDIAATGDLNLAARAELIRCGLRISTLDFSPCRETASLLPHAGPDTRTYFQFLYGPWNGLDVGALPRQYRHLVSATDPIERNRSARKIEDPRSRLIAAALLLNRGEIDPETASFALKTASRQGWRRPVLVWLNILLKKAESSGDENAVRRLKKQMELVLESEP